MIQINALADNIYAFEERAGNIRCFLIIGKDRALLLDSGIGDVDFQEELPKLTKLPVTLVNTHGDFDHTAKNSLFTDRFVHPGDLPAIRRTHPEDLGEYKPLKEGDEFDLGGTVLTVLECPGHTEGSIMLFDKACGILFFRGQHLRFSRMAVRPGKEPKSVYFYAARAFRPETGHKKGHRMPWNV